MHPTAFSNGKLFFDTYVSRLGPVRLVEIGSQNVNGSLRDVCPPSVEYLGLDFEDAKGVDIVLTDPYSLPIEDESADIVVSSSCFEHSEMFWLVFTEALRVLKPNGLFYLNVPSNGAFHRYPVDCWRFYPDAGNALVTWGRRCGFKPALLESYTVGQYQDIWNDFVAVFIKDEAHVSAHPGRILPLHDSFENGLMYGNTDILRKQGQPEDIRRSSALSARLAEAEAHERAMANETDQLREVISQLQCEASQLQGEASQLRGEASQLQGEASQLRGEASQLRGEASQLRAEIAAYKQKLEEANSRIFAIESSTSWRITAPIRTIKQRLSASRVDGGKVQVEGSHPRPSDPIEKDERRS
jgi:SAM-dependent methyltransferase